ncbi:unnamed protein product, partial [Meganyctiphanes norvegica]
CRDLRTWHCSRAEPAPPTPLIRPTAPGRTIFLLPLQQVSLWKGACVDLVRRRPPPAAAAAAAAAARCRPQLVVTSVADAAPYVTPTSPYRPPPARTAFCRRRVLLLFSYRRRGPTTIIDL